MPVYGYARVSTAQQAEDGESLDVQRRVMAGYAMQKGLTLERVFVERGVSGSKPLAKRPEGSRLLEVLAPGDVILTPKLDRMFRSARDALDVLECIKGRGVSLHMIDLGGDVTGDGISKLVFTILSAVAEAERDRTRERVREVKRDQAARRRFLGGSRPFGWRLIPDDRGAELEPVPEEQDAIRQMIEMRRSGSSLRAIAAEMTRAGFTLSHVAVSKIVGATP